MHVCTLFQSNAFSRRVCVSKFIISDILNKNKNVLQPIKLKTYYGIELLLYYELKASDVSNGRLFVDSN